VTYWLELNTGQRHNGTGTLARHAGSGPHQRQKNSARPQTRPKDIKTVNK